MIDPRTDQGVIRVDLPNGEVARILWSPNEPDVYLDIDGEYRGSRGNTTLSALSAAIENTGENSARVTVETVPGDPSADMEGGL